MIIIAKDKEASVQNTDRVHINWVIWLAGGKKNHHLEACLAMFKCAPSNRVT